MVAEALECLGGNGYVEESVLPRLYREAPLNSIWEGSGNVERARRPAGAAHLAGAVDALLDEVALARGGDARLDAFAAGSPTTRAPRRERREDAAWGARALVVRMALALQASLLVRHAPAAVADAFCASRLAAEPGLALTLGTLPAGTDAAAVLDRAL